MALFEGAKRVPNSRSFSRLVVSEGFSPAERWIADDNLNPLFEYHYGGPGWVVIPKGTIVAVDDNAYDYEVGREVTTLTVARKTADASVNKQPAGVAPYNIYQRVMGRLYHNFPSLITRDYIEVPLLEDVASVYRDTDGSTASEVPTILNSVTLKMRWGCAYHGADPSTQAIEPGAYVMADGWGKFIRWDGDNFEDVVGQVLAVETDLPPTGWLKWLDWAEEHGERADDQNNLPYPENPDEGRTYHPDYKWPLTPDYRGIPGMTDGGNTDQVGVNNEATGAEAAHQIPEGTEEGTILIFRLANAPLVDDADFDMEVDLVGNGTWTDAAGSFQIDKTTGWVYYSVTDAEEAAAASANVSVRFSYTYHSTLNLGTPAAWDFKGSTGAARILLKF